jgi:catechol 2,3-dioxygenase-like lactoylglutathione lyase family enzyme
VRELPHGGTVVLRVDDLDLARAGLEGRGVRFDDHVGEVDGRARFASFADPDGNRLQLIEYAGGVA